MQSGTRNTKNWLLEFDTLNTGINPLMGWESSTDTLSELKLEFSTKESAIDYAKKNKIIFEIIEPNQRKILKNLTQIILLNKCLNFLLKNNGFYGVY